MNKYKLDVFQSTGTEFELPKDFPYEITVINQQGEQSILTIRRHSDLDFRKVVAVKVHTPTLSIEIHRATGVSLGSITKVLNYIEGESKPEPKSWIENWVDVNFPNVYTGLRSRIISWFNNPDEFPDVANADIENRVLTVKFVSGGRVVQAPTGHTIAYSTAKMIWHDMKTGDTPHTDYPSVGEYNGRKAGWTHKSYYRIKITKGGVTIGCQFIPKSAIADLAEREGW